MIFMIDNSPPTTMQLVNAQDCDDRVFKYLFLDPQDISMAFLISGIIPGQCMTEQSRLEFSNQME